MLRRTMLRLGLKTRAELFALPEDELEEWFAFDLHLQRAVVDVVSRLAKKEMLSPEAYTMLMLARL